MKKKILSIFLSLAIMMSLIPTISLVAFADNEQQEVLYIGNRTYKAHEIPFSKNGCSVTKDGDEYTLTLDNYNADRITILSKKWKVILKGKNTINVIDSHEICAFNVMNCQNVAFSGAGSLNLHGSNIGLEVSDSTVTIEDGNFKLASNYSKTTNYAPLYICNSTLTVNGGKIETLLSGNGISVSLDNSKLNLFNAAIVSSSTALSSKSLVYLENYSSINLDNSQFTTDEFHVENTSKIALNDKSELKCSTANINGNSQLYISQSDVQCDDLEMTGSKVDLISDKLSCNEMDLDYQSECNVDKSAKLTVETKLSGKGKLTNNGELTINGTLDDSLQLNNSGTLSGTGHAQTREKFYIAQNPNTKSRYEYPGPESLNLNDFLYNTYNYPLSDGGDITYLLDQNSFGEARIEGNTIYINKPGTYKILAKTSGSIKYEPAQATIEIKYESKNCIYNIGGDVSITYGESWPSNPSGYFYPKCDLDAPIVFSYYQHGVNLGTTCPKAVGSYLVVAECTDKNGNYAYDSCNLYIKKKKIHGSDLEYTGGPITKVYDGTTDCSLTSVKVKDGILVGDDSLIIKGSATFNSPDVKDANSVIFLTNKSSYENYEVEYNAEITINEAKITPSLYVPTVSELADCSYRGYQIKPWVTVKNGDKTLEENTDYTLEYGNNVNSGKNAGSIFLKPVAQGNYSFSPITKYFNINRKPLDNININLSKNNFKYTGEAIKPEITSVSGNDGSVTVPSSNYDVTYSNNVNVGKGTVSIKLKDSSNYSGEKSTTFTIDKADSIKIPNISENPMYTDTSSKTVSLEGKMPNDAKNVSYSKGTKNDSNDIIDSFGVNSSTGEVTFSLKDNLSFENQSATLPIVIKSDNYEDSTVNINISLRDKDAQSITLSTIGAKTYGDEPFTLGATDLSGDGTVSYESSHPSVISIDGTTATIKKAGTTEISAIISGSNTQKKAVSTQTVNVAKKELTIKTSDKSIYTDDSMPKFTYTVEGLVNGDKLNNPEITCLAQNSIFSGNFNIEVSGGDLSNSENYDVKYLSGKLTIIDKYYSIGVTNGSSDLETAIKGKTVSVTADKKDGYNFKNWSSNDVTFDDSSSETTTFTMPNKNVSLIANYEKVIPYNNIKSATTDELSSIIEGLRSGDKLTITTTDSNGVLPKELFDKIKGLNIAITIKAGNGIVIEFNGNDIPSDFVSKNIDFTIISTPGTMTQQQIDNLVAGNINKILNFKNSGPFGFKIKLSIPMGKNYVSKTAQLNYYNPVLKTFELLANSAIDNNGTAKFDFVHSSEYVVVIKDTSTPKDNPTTNPGETNPGETNPGETNPGTTTPGETNPGTTTPGETNPGTTIPGTTNSVTKTDIANDDKKFNSDNAVIDKANNNSSISRKESDPKTGNNPLSALLLLSTLSIAGAVLIKSKKK